MSTSRLFDKWGLTALRKLVPEFTSNGRSVSLGDEIVLKVGAGETEYMSFGDLEEDSARGKIHHAYRQGSGHNLGNDGHIKYQYSTDGGATWSAPVEIITDGSGSYNTTNPALKVTSTGRLLCVFTKQDLPSSENTQQTYVIYSDDGGTTWSSDGYDGSEILMSNDSVYMNMIGKPVEMAGVLMQPIYRRISDTSGNEYVVIYQSSDDGLTWTLRSQATDGTASSITNAGETSLLVRNDNVIIANMRGSSAPIGNYGTYSLDGGLTWWPKPYRLGNTKSKNPMAISPSGTILTCGRNVVTGYTMYGYSSDGGRTFNYARIDEREGTHEYSGIIWDSIRERFVIIYYVETGASTDSPTDIVLRYVNEVSGQSYSEPSIFRMLVIGDSIARGTSDGSGQADEFRSGILREYQSGAHLSEAPLDVVDAVTGSPYPSFANTIISEANKITHLVNCGVGGSEFSPNSDTNNWSTTGVRYAAMSTKASNYLATQPAGTAFDVIRITLGINDARGTAELSTINTDAISLIDRLTADFPTSKIVINQLGKSDADTDRVTSIRATIDSLVSTYDSVYAGTDLNTYPEGAYTDGLHLNQTYNDQLGEDDATIINGLL